MPWQCQMYEKIEMRAYSDEHGSGHYAVFRGPDGGEYTFKTLPFGAMFFDPDCHWADACKRPDGRCLVVKVPGRDGAGNVRGFLWPIDHPSSGGGPGWTRTGEPPNVTASPSINYAMGALGYHGWLQDGVLTDDCEGRTYD
jgi:hypothetical protein